MTATYGEKQKLRLLPLSHIISQCLTISFSKDVVFHFQVNYEIGTQHPPTLLVKFTHKSNLQFSCLPLSRFPYGEGKRILFKYGFLVLKILMLIIV